MSNLGSSQVKKILTWGEYCQLIEKLAFQIQQSSWHIDAIVCLARGGFCAGDILSRLFQVPLSVLMVSSYRDKGGTEQAELKTNLSLASVDNHLSGNVLIVDDLIDTGRTLEFVVQHFQTHYPHIRHLKTAVLWTKVLHDISQFKADYCVDFVSSDTWIVQPFECYEGFSKPLHNP